MFWTLAVGPGQMLSRLKFREEHRGFCSSIYMKREDVYNIGEGKVGCLQVSVSEEHGGLVHLPRTGRTMNM